MAVSTTSCSFSSTGRSVYTPLFSGVYWNVQDVMLEDVDRIEVIRGPGATFVGANAVDGVINIITKPAKLTQGAMVTVEAGTEERTAESARYTAARSATISIIELIPNIPIGSLR